MPRISCRQPPITNGKNFHPAAFAVDSFLRAIEKNLLRAVGFVSVLGQYLMRCMARPQWRGEDAMVHASISHTSSLFLPTQFNLTQLNVETKQ